MRDEGLYFCCFPRQMQEAVEWLKESWWSLTGKFSAWKRTILMPAPEDMLLLGAGFSSTDAVSVL